MSHCPDVPCCRDPRMDFTAWIANLCEPGLQCMFCFALCLCREWRTCCSLTRETIPSLVSWKSCAPERERQLGEMGFAVWKKNKNKSYSSDILTHLRLSGVCVCVCVCDPLKQALSVSLSVDCDCHSTNSGRSFSNSSDVSSPACLSVTAVHIDVTGHSCNLNSMYTDPPPPPP